MSFNFSSHDSQFDTSFMDWLGSSGLGGEESASTALQALYPVVHQDALENLVKQPEDSIAHESAQYSLAQTTALEAVLLGAAQRQVYDALTNFLARPDAGQLVGAEFGQDWHHDELIGSIQSYLTDGQTPNVEVVATAAIEKAFRSGYSAATKTIYFDRDFLALTSPEELVGAYLDELGHYWQSQTEWDR